MLGQLVLQGGGPFISNDELDSRVLQGMNGYVRCCQLPRRLKILLH